MYHLLNFDFPTMSYKSLKLFTFFGTPCSIESAKTFEADHLPIQMTLNLTANDNSASYDGDPQCSYEKKSKLLWSKFSLVDINTKYVTPLLYDSEKGDIGPTDSERAV